MKKDSFMKFIDNQSDFYTSSDFQTDYTGGYPTTLCWNGYQAWMELADGPNDENQAYWKMCADFGVVICNDTDDFNRILEKLGRDAVEMAELPEDFDESLYF